MKHTSIKIISLLFLVFFTASCEQEMPEAALEAAEGGEHYEITLPILSMLRIPVDPMYMGAWFSGKVP